MILPNHFLQIKMIPDNKTPDLVLLPSKTPNPSIEYAPFTGQCRRDHGV